MPNLTLIRTAAAGIFLAFTLTACGSTTAYDDGDYYDRSTHETEDCDVDDIIEGDSDCYGSDGHSTKKHKTTKPGTTRQKTTRPKTSTSKSSTGKSSTKSGGGSTSSTPKSTGRR